uniref:AlNc14C201G8686 protein n=1 Tax=Albugo laibachii Nc14 TaxID=890382 RepID=F0WQM4_9STRA|nr:AlNc14C201G8686 [Albugo laibachii Nc14]|eukprot:CCA23633.1 AlNc14C201G8686 [Albugo laibachii Nc14]
MASFLTIKLSISKSLRGLAIDTLLEKPYLFNLLTILHMVDAIVIALASWTEFQVWIGKAGR